jgi:aldehyde:ferredoxin oxidoreductase
MDTWFYAGNIDDRLRSTDLAQRYGISTFEISQTRAYANTLHSQGILDDNALPFDQDMTMAYSQALCDRVAYKRGDVGADMALGRVRWSAKLGRLEEDLTDGTIQCPSLGMKTHHYFPGNEWSFKQIFSDRDINEHDFQFMWRVLQKFCVPYTETSYVSPETAANILAEKCVPVVGESSPFNWDHGHGATGIYSRGRATAVGYYAHSTRFYKQALGFCDFHWPMYYTANAADFRGPSGADTEAETKYFNAVTGNNFTWADGMNVGRRIWNLDRAIWVLQGRSSATDKFAPYMYTNIGRISGIYMFPVYLDGKWQWWSRSDFEENKPVFDAGGVEEFKTHFYDLEGWNTNGVPTRATLESLDLGFVADKLEAAGKL